LLVQPLRRRRLHLWLPGARRRAVQVRLRLPAGRPLQLREALIAVASLPLRTWRHRGATFAMLLAGMLPALTQAEEVRVIRADYSLQVEQQGGGRAIIVFESGFGQGPAVWKSVIADLGAECRCVAYARTGLGTSGTDGTPNTIDKHVRDLAAVIDALAPNQKVVLVGHSYGGLVAAEYARSHPDRLRGLVLVDPATMGQRRDFERADRDRVLADDKAKLSMLPPGLAKDYEVLVALLDGDAAALPPGPIDVPVALLTSTRVAAEPFVLEETAQGKARWKHQHAELFASFSRGSHQYFDTGHNIHRENPRAVADAVRTVLAATIEAAPSAATNTPSSRSR